MPVEQTLRGFNLGQGSSSFKKQWPPLPPTLHFPYTIPAGKTTLIVEVADFGREVVSAGLV